MATVIVAGGATGIGRASVQGFRARGDDQTDAKAKRDAIEAQIPLRRQGEPKDVSSMVLFLAAPEGRYIAGSSIIIDGGYTAV